MPSGEWQLLWSYGTMYSRGLQPVLLTRNSTTDIWRWISLGTKESFLRRLIRLHPMVVAGVLLGAVLLNLFMVPAVPGTGPEIRGYGEMFPLNGPNWSLFFEYIGNIIYALLIRRLPTKALAVLTLLSMPYALGTGSPAVPFPRRCILSCLCYTLSVHVPVLCVAVEEWRKCAFL